VAALAGLEAVVLLGEPVVGEDQLADGERAGGGGGAGGEPLPPVEPLGDEPAVGLAALRGGVGAEEVVPAFDRDAGRPELCRR
jgi:hypothetical protein